MSNTAFFCVLLKLCSVGDNLLLPVVENLFLSLLTPSLKDPVMGKGGGGGMFFFSFSAYPFLLNWLSIT